MASIVSKNADVRVDGPSSSIPRLRAADRIYEGIRSDILSGRLASGERLTEEVLAERFGASRTPVRSAIVKLASDGFVDMTPHSGTVVKRRDLKEISEIYVVRAILESAAAGLAAIHRQATDVTALERLQDEMERQGLLDPLPIEELARLNKEFHFRILQASGNRTIRDAVVRLMEPGFLLKTYAKFSTPDFSRIFFEHRNILTAIRAKDAAFAEAAMRAHIDATRRAL